MKVIENNKVDSIRDLSRKVRRKASNVHNDLVLLAEYGILELKKKGNRKIPKIKPENIFIKPENREDTLYFRKNNFSYVLSGRN